MGRAVEHTRPPSEHFMTPLSILELVRVTQATDARGALNNARDLAAHAEKLGYQRVWVAEHHNMAGIASAATSVVLAYIAEGTTTIRVGAGGIMLPNHAPYVIAEQFGPLARLFPGRIDLGLGRAPGTDQLTLRARRRRHHAAQPCALRHRRTVRAAGAAVSGPHRPRAGPRAGHRPAHAARPAPAASCCPTMRPTSSPNSSGRWRGCFRAASTSGWAARRAPTSSRCAPCAGGIMLPNHAPYVIAEQFGTLARLFPGRIDLGLGRAPGTDQLTLRALRRTPEAAENFPQDVLEVQAFLAAAGPNQRIQAVPAAGTNVPLWILGSSHFGAMLAAELGLPYSFASHFAPELLLPALEIYRARFRPSEQLDRPYAMVGVNIIAAATDAEARRLATTQQMSFVNLFRGARGLSQPPIDDIESYWSPLEKARAARMLARSIIGSPETVRSGIEA